LDSTVAANATAAPMQLPVVDSGTTILTTAGYLCLLLGIIYLAYYLLKRFGSGMLPMAGANGPHMVSRLMVGARQSVTVVRYKGRDLVLGVTEQQITVLAETEADDENGEPAPKKSFSSFLKKERG